MSQAQGDVWLWKRNNKLTMQPDGSWTQTNFLTNENLLNKDGYFLYPVAYRLDCDAQFTYLYSDSLNMLLNRNFLPMHNAASWNARRQQSVYWPQRTDSLLLFGIRYHAVNGLRLERVVIDTSAQGGLGSVVGQPTEVSPNPVLGFTITRHSSPNKFWLLYFDHTLQSLKSVLIDSSGLNTQIGDSYRFNITFQFNSPVLLTASPDATLLSVIRTTNYKIFLIRFDPSSGTFRTLLDLGPISMTSRLAGTASVVFSRDSRFMYTSGVWQAHNLHQWSLDRWDSLSILNSGVAIDSGYDWSGNDLITGFTPGPDGHLYLMRRSTPLQRYYFDRIRYIDSLYHPLHRDSAYIVLPPNPDELNNLGYLPQLAPYRYARDRYSIVTQAQGCMNQPHELQLREQEYLNQVIWYTGDSTAGVANSMVGKRVFANYSTPGRYTVTAYAEYCNRWDTLRYTVDILGLPPAAPVTDTVFCAGGSVAFTLPAGLSYRWSDGDTSRLKSFAAGGSYWLESSNACYTRRDSFELRAQEPPQHGLPADTSVCVGDVLVLAPQAGDYRWRWSDGDTLARQVQGGGTHILLLENSCGTFPWSIQVWERTPPQPQLPADTSICEGQLLRIALDADPRTTYLWSDGSRERIRLLSEVGSYEVVATNACGTGSAQLNLTTEDCACTLYAPTAFSPNGDGLNERYAIVTRCVLRDFSLLVYNRWGELVYSSTQLDQSWDGTIGGKPAPPGNYVYQLSYYREGLGPRQSSGSFVLLR